MSLIIKKQYLKVALSIVLTIVVSGGFYVYGSSTNQPSDWAKESVETLKSKNAIEESFFKDFQAPITRKDFAYLAVKLFEILNDTTAPSITSKDNDLFKDTINSYVIKAYRLGIINGYGDKIFGPDDLVTREQICVMLIKTLNISGINLNNRNIHNINFKDQSQISSWALESTRLAYKHKIMNGVAEHTIAPKLNTTREQALFLVENVLRLKNTFDTSTETVDDNNIRENITSSIAKPVLKWKHGGAFSSWTETGWYSSPVVVDLDQDGDMEIVASAYSVVVLDAVTGDLIWRVKSGHDRSEPEAKNVGRTWSDVIVKDIDLDGQLEIITAHGNGYVSVYDQDGNFKTGWPKQPVTRELRGLKVEDLDMDGTEEIIVTAAVGSKLNTWVYKHNGDVRTGWPQLDNDTGYAYGVFNNNASVGDLTGDGIPEIVVPSDVHYICAYYNDGTQVQANSMYGDKKWGKVGIWESLETELRGWGKCDGDRAESYRTNFAHGASVITDVDNNGSNEVIAIGNVYNCKNGHPPGMYNGVYIFNADRSRFNNGTYNWEVVPINTGAPLTEDYNIIENNQPDPIVEDLDGDGIKEIIFSSYDGKVHAYWLDKTEHNQWPYSIYNKSEAFYRFGSVPEVKDLDKDGFKEIIVTSWTQKGSNYNGKLHILNYKGIEIWTIDLPDSFGTTKENGALASPVIADVDKDGKWEIVLNTTHSGFVVYDLD